MNRSGGGSGESALFVVALAAMLAGLLYVPVAAPTFIWSLLHGEPTVMGFGSAVGGALRWLFSGADGDPRTLPALAAYRDVMPSPGVWTALNVGILAAAVSGIAVVLVRVDRWRGARTVGLPRWHPRGWVRPRSWARPRDLRHLRNGPLATARGDGADSWSLGELRGRPLRSGPESHLMAVAPTRSGKTTRVVVPALLEHRGPAIVLLNKTDVVLDTVKEREQRGPVWVCAPFTCALPHRCGWSPLAGCQSWEYALRMGRWLFDADPTITQDRRTRAVRAFTTARRSGWRSLPSSMPQRSAGGTWRSFTSGCARASMVSTSRARSSPVTARSGRRMRSRASRASTSARARCC